MALLALFVLAAPLATPGRSAGALSAQLHASAASGTAPMEVSFTVVPSEGAPTSYNWSFGDGSYYNGSTLTYASPVHDFLVPGTFTVEVLVWEGSEEATASQAISVAPGPLSVSITASAATGPAPLTVFFRADPLGGSGTFVRFAWQLGDGGTGVGPLVADTYRNPGSYRVAVNVTDSSGSSAEATRTIVVQANSSSGTAGSPATVLGAIVLGAVAAGAATTFTILRRRGPPPEDPERPVFSPLYPFEPPSMAQAPGAGIGVASVETVRPQISADADLAPHVPAGVGVLATPSAELTERRLLSRMIVVRLAELGRLNPDDIPDSRWTQRGLGDALGVSQNRVSNVLRRLTAAGALVEEVRHVSGRPRRVKVYRLSGRGEALARSFRTRAGRASGAGGAENAPEDGKRSRAPPPP